MVAPPARKAEVMKRLLLSSGLLLSLVAGCGASRPEPPVTATSLTRLEADAAGTRGLSICALLPVDRVERIVGVAGLDARANDSLDLAQCRYAARRVNVRVLLDGAAQAQRRYFEQQAEAQQKFNTIPAMKPRDVTGVGDDATPGSAGAFWTRARHQLVAIDHERIARVTVDVPGRAEATLKRQAGDLARQLFVAVRRRG